jgi:hypothetical protein
MTYKFSQDPLEHFFGELRSRCGYNDNPDASAFKAAYRAILQYRIGFVAGTCDPPQPLPASPSANCSEVIEDGITNALSPGLCEDVILSWNQLSSIEYITGFIVKKITTTLSCSTCNEFLSGNSTEPTSLLAIKNTHNRLAIPSSAAVRLAHECEKVIQRMGVVDAHQVRLSNSKFCSAIFRKILGGSLLSNLVCNSLEDNHGPRLVKSFASLFFGIRAKQTAKIHRQKLRSMSVRTRLHKTILFLNQ